MIIQFGGRFFLSKLAHLKLGWDRAIQFEQIHHSQEWCIKFISKNSREQQQQHNNNKNTIIKKNEVEMGI